MLQGIRDILQRHKWFMYIVLGSLALIFAAWGAVSIGNFNAGGTTYAAEAGGDKVSVEDARNAWIREQSEYQQRMGGEIPAAQKPVLQDHLLESMIRESLLSQRVHDLGYRVSDQDLVDAIRDIPAFQIEGKYNSEVAKERLAQAGITLDRFEAEMRSSLQRAQLQSGIAASDFQTPVEIARDRSLRDEQREVRYALLPPDKYSADVQVDDAAIQAYYKGHQAQYMTPEAVHLKYAELRLDQVQAQVKVSDEDLHKAYDKKKDTYIEPEKRHGRHILITIGKDDAAARKQAEDVLAQVKAGKDFAALAKQYSQDPGSANNGGDLGWADRNQFVGPFADALFSMKVGDIQGPVKTQFGYHIIRLDEIQPGKARTFDQVRSELEADLRRGAATDRFGEIQEQIQQRMEQSATDIDTLAKEFNLQTGDIAQFQRGAGGAPLGVAKPIQDLVFGDSPLQNGKIGGPVLVGDDRLVILDVLDHHNPAPRPLAEVRDGIVAAIKKEKGSEAALKAAQDAKAKLEAGTSFDDVARQLGVTSEPAKFVGRTDPALPTQLRDLVFNSPKPAENKAVYRATALPTGGAALVAITQLRAGGPVEAQSDQLKQEFLQAKQEAVHHGQADADAYVEEMRRTAEVRKNPKVFE